MENEDDKCIDMHIHVNNDKKPGEFVEADIIQAYLKKCGLHGGVACTHPSQEDYKKDYEALCEYYEDYDNLIPGLEYSHQIIINNNYYGSCHIIYLGVVKGEPFYYFSHATSVSGFLSELSPNRKFNKKTINKVMKNTEIKKRYDLIFESTKNLEDALMLNSYGFITLLGTDVHPDENNKYNGKLGRLGILVELEEVTREGLIKCLKKRKINYFEKNGNHYRFTDYCEDNNNARVIRKKKLDTYGK